MLFRMGFYTPRFLRLSFGLEPCNALGLSLGPLIATILLGLALWIAAIMARFPLRSAYSQEHSSRCAPLARNLHRNLLEDPMIFFI